MKSIFDSTARAELINRINNIRSDLKPNWGKMTINQMIQHCILWEEMMAGKLKIRRKFLGYLFGKISMKDQIGNEKPIKQNIPTFEELKVADTDLDIDTLKEKWIAYVLKYENYNQKTAIHPFMGKMTREQVGFLAYKHIDHHLRQFSA